MPAQKLRDAFRQYHGCDPINRAALQKHWYLDGNDRSAKQPSEKQIGNDRCAGLDHVTYQIRVSSERQWLAKRPERIDHLLPIGIGKDDIIRLHNARCLLRLQVEFG